MDGVQGCKGDLMKEQFDPPEDFSDDQAELKFEPIMTQELLLFDPEVRRRAEVLAEQDPGNGSEDVVPVRDVQVLPPVLEVETNTRKALIRVWFIMAALTVVTLVQFTFYLGLRNRAPILIYAEAPPDTLVQPWR